MKILSSLLITSMLFTTAIWKTNINEAETEAVNNNQLILISFSGSDWCSPCIQLKKNIFNSEAFMNYASENLILVNADFPRQTKHKLPADQKKMNEDLADKYNPEGKFPLTLLITAEGKVIKQWDGLPSLSPEQFVDEIKKVNANR